MAGKAAIKTAEDVIREVAKKLKLNYKVKLRGTPPGMLMNSFAKAHIARKGLESDEEAELGAYRNKDKKLFIPGVALWNCVINASKSKKIGKKSASTFFASGFVINETELILDKDEYEIFSCAVRIPPRTGARVIKHRPLLPNWEVEFTCTLDTRVFGQAPSELIRMLKEVIDYAGLFVGVLDFRPAMKGPYGKFEVVEFEQIKQV